MAAAPLADTVRLPAEVPVPLVQLNLKLPAEVLEEWRRRAAEAGHGSSVRDWLLSVLSPTAEETPALADRVAALEEAVAQLRLQQARPAAPRRAVPVAPSPRALPGTDTAVLVSGEAIDTSALASLLGMKAKSINAAARKAGGARDGLELYGWRCVGTFRLPQGGHPVAHWVPVGTASSTGAEEAAATGLVPVAEAAALPGYLPGLEPVPAAPGLGT